MSVCKCVVGGYQRRLYLYLVEISMFIFPYFVVVMGIGLVGSVMFIVLQIIFLVDFAHSWAENW